MRLTLRVDRDQAEQFLDVLRVHADAAVRHLHADTGRLVRAVNEIRATGNAEPHLVLAERIVRPRRHDLRQRIAALLVLLRTDSGGYQFGRFSLVTIFVTPIGVFQSILAGTDRVSAHHARLARPGRREVIHPVLGQVDDDAFTRRLRNDVARRNQDLGALARQPRIDARVRGQDLLVAHPVATGDVEKGVLMRGQLARVRTDDVVAVEPAAGTPPPTPQLRPAAPLLRRPSVLP